MKLATPSQMKAIDGYAIKTLGIPGVVLMENAALKVVEQAEKILGGASGKQVLLIAGKGNNGGDAFAVARHLYCRDVRVMVCLLAEKASVTGDARINLDILDRMNIKVAEIPDEARLGKYLIRSNDFKNSDLIIDGIFGTGFRGAVEGVVDKIVGMINRSGLPVLSIDIPSGLHGETGMVQTSCVEADVTVTFCLPKTGLVTGVGSEYTGELVTVDIGIPAEAVEHARIRTELVEGGQFCNIFKKRRSTTNKGNYGKALIITGSAGMTGSGCLCARAAMRTGAGLVYTGVPSTLAGIYSSSLTEPIVIPLEDTGTGRLSETCIPRILGILDTMDVVAIGPGLSLDRGIPKIVAAVIRESRKTVVLDADALNAISSDLYVLKERKAEVIITPHPGEMARLAGISVKEVQDDRIGVAVAFAAKWGVITVLKGSGTVTASPDGRVFVNSSGNPGMATGGSGDVLAGIIASLAGQGVNSTEAAAAGAYLHGLAGDLAALEKGQHAMIAGDIIESLPKAIQKISLAGETGANTGGTAPIGAVGGTNGL